MSSRVAELIRTGYIKNYPSAVKSVEYETIMGSHAYGMSNADSDIDIYGFCIPAKDIVFPNIIMGFDKQYNQFEQFQLPKCRLQQPNKILGKIDTEYEGTIFSIVKYFRLCADCNPNMLDSLFTHRQYVTHISKIGEMVKENRHLFLSKKVFHTMRGYSYSQLHKAKSKNPQDGSNRYKLRQQYGMDVKFLAHVVRLVNQAQQILETGDLDLLTSKEQLKAIRRGDVPQKDIEKYFYEKERHLERLYNSSSLPYKVDDQKIRQLLLDCLEEFYGNLDRCVVREDEAARTLTSIGELVDKYRSKQT